MSTFFVAARFSTADVRRRSPASQERLLSDALRYLFVDFSARWRRSSFGSAIKGR
jgi:hypothetical protein